ncbi:MAG: type VI secretion system tube protein Hcp, partial [Paracoccaceae bacterium]
MTFDGFLDFRGDIDGNSTDAQHLNSFELLDFNILISRFEDPSDGKTFTFIEPLILDISPVDGARSSILEAVEAGTVLQEVQIEIVRDADATTEQVTQRLTLSNVVIGAYGEGLDENARLALTFATIEIDTLGYNPGGTRNEKLDRSVFLDTTDIDVFQEPPGQGSAQADDPSGRTSAGFLKLDGIEGESEDSEFGNQIEILDIDLGFTKPTQTPPAFDPLYVDIDNTDKAVVKIFEALTTGKSVVNATASLTDEQSGIRSTYETITAGNVIFNSLVRDDDFATRLGLGFQTIQIETTTSDSKGTQVNAVKYEADLAADDILGEPALLRGVGTEQEQNPGESLYLVLDGIAGSNPDLVGLTDPFELSGFGYALENTTNASPLNRGETSFRALTVDFAQADEVGFATLLDRLATDTEIASAKIVRRSDSFDKDLEVIELVDVNLASLSLDPGLAPRATFGFDEIKLTYQTLASNGKLAGDVATAFDLVDKQTDFPTLAAAFAGDTGIGPREAGGGAVQSLFLDLGDIKGNTQDDDFDRVDAFDVVDFSFGIERVDIPFEGGGATSAFFRPLTIDLKPDDAGIVKIIEAVENATFFQGEIVKLHVRNSTSEEIALYELSD